MFDDDDEYYEEGEFYEILHSIPADEEDNHILSMMCPCCPDAGYDERSGLDFIYHKEMGDSGPHEYLTEVLRVFEN
jgi:hypothetical protein